MFNLAHVCSVDLFSSSTTDTEGTELQLPDYILPKAFREGIFPRNVNPLVFVQGSALGFLCAPLVQRGAECICPRELEGLAIIPPLNLHIEPKTRLHCAAVGYTLQNVTNTASSPDRNRLSTVKLGVVPVQFRE